MKMNERFPFGFDYGKHTVKQETEKAYLLAIDVNGRFGWRTEYKWIGKSQCRVSTDGYVYAPDWLVPMNSDDQRERLQLWRDMSKKERDRFITLSQRVAVSGK